MMLGCEPRRFAGLLCGMMLAALLCAGDYAKTYMSLGDLLSLNGLRTTFT